MRGCEDAWMRGCVDAWMRGCVDAWMRGCEDAGMRGCVDAWTGEKEYEDLKVKNNLLYGSHDFIDLMDQ
jgi:hypothetical protein